MPRDQDQDQATGFLLYVLSPNSSSTLKPVFDKDSSDEVTDLGNRDLSQSIRNAGHPKENTASALYHRGVRHSSSSSSTRSHLPDADTIVPSSSRSPPAALVKQASHDGLDECSNRSGLLKSASGCQSTK